FDLDLITTFAANSPSDACAQNQIFVGRIDNGVGIGFSDVSLHQMNLAVLDFDLHGNRVVWELECYGHRKNITSRKTNQNKFVPGLCAIRRPHYQKELPRWLASDTLAGVTTGWLEALSGQKSGSPQGPSTTVCSAEKNRDLLTSTGERSISP